MFGLLSLLRGEQPRYFGFPDTPVDWDPMMKFGARLYIRASSFQPALLYPKTRRQGRFQYENQVLPAGKPLQTWLGNRKGVVKFDRDITIPSLFDLEILAKGWNRNPWMSITPSEIFTLRAGTKRAKKHTVVAGLGLGYQLVDVMKRKQVTQVTLVEKERDVVKLVLPRLKKYLPDKPLKVMVGDAKILVPKLTADVALIDIFESFGWNRFPPCPNIPSVWIWGGKHERLP